MSKSLGMLWEKLYCKKCNEEVEVKVSREDQYYVGDANYPRIRVIWHNCVCCNQVLGKYDLTADAQEEWDDNAEYCSQNFRNYIVLRDQMRNEEED